MKKIVIILCGVFTLFMSNHALGQVTEDWVARYNGPDNKMDNARKIVVDGEGNIYVTGSSQTKSGSSITTVKYNTAGMQQWVARYSASSKGDEYPYGLTVDNNGNVYVTGRSTGSGSAVDIVIIKYNLSGTQQWVSRYNGPANLSDVPGDIEVDISGNVFVTGFADAVNILGPGAAIITLKYTVSGSLEWISRYDQLPNDGTGVNKEEGVSLTLDGSGNVCVTGQSGGLVTLKYDPSGQLQWTRNGGTSSGRKILADGADNIIVTGFGSKTIKYNTSGDLMWEADYPNAGFWDMALDASGNVYVVGSSRDNGTSDDYRTVKYNVNGEQQWSKRFNGDANGIDLARSIALDGDGNVYITGQCVLKAGRNTNENYATIKYNNSGDEQWLMYYDGPSKSVDRGFCIAVDDFGNIYVTGESAAKTSSFDFATIKYSQNTGSKAVMINPSPKSPASFQLKNYPNPFSQNTTIEFYLPQEERVRLIVYDLLGREVATLVNENKVAGVHFVNFNSSNLLPGTYYYRIQSGEISESRKLVLLK